MDRRTPAGFANPIFDGHGVRAFALSCGRVGILFLSGAATLLDLFAPISRRRPSASLIFATIRLERGLTSELSSYSAEQKKPCGSDNGLLTQFWHCVYIPGGLTRVSA